MFSAHILATLFWICLAANESLAQSGSDVDNDVENARKIIAQKAVLGALTIVVGLILLIVGQRIWKATLFFCGFFITGLAGYILLVHFEPSSGYDHRQTVLLLGSLACGMVGGGIALCLWKLGLVALGATAGFLFGMFLLSWKSNGLVSGTNGRIILLSICTGIGAILAVVLQKRLLIVGTSIAGAYSVIFGIDCFAQTGFTQSVNNFLSSPSTVNYENFDRSRDVIILLCAMVVLAVLGIIIQARFTRRIEVW
ncbi:hypothetical protein HKX48_007240 [Thoreauomyces humboldtii]|nr:hypothetical protein HKX48_007240 [Thoreauomyces humboldtii]